MPSPELSCTVQFPGCSVITIAESALRGWLMMSKGEVFLARAAAEADHGGLVDGVLGLFHFAAASSPRESATVATGDVIFTTRRPRLRGD